MIAEIVLIAMAVMFLILGIFLFNGKGSRLIAGYNMMSEKEKKQYDEKKLCRAVGSLCIMCCVMLAVMAYMGYRVDTGAMKEESMLPFALSFAAVIIIAVIAVNVYINRKAKRR